MPAGPRKRGWRVFPRNFNIHTMVFFEISINDFLCGKLDNGTFSDEHGEEVTYSKIPNIEKLNTAILEQMQHRDPSYPISKYRPDMIEVGKAKIINTGGQCGEVFLSSVAMVIYRCR